AAARPTHACARTPIAVNASRAARPSGNRPGPGIAKSPTSIPSDSHAKAPAMASSASATPTSPRQWATFTRIPPGLVLLQAQRRRDFAKGLVFLADQRAQLVGPAEPEGFAL